MLDAPPEIRQLSHMDSVIWIYWLIKIHTDNGRSVPPYLMEDDMLYDTHDYFSKRKFMNRCSYSQYIYVGKDVFDSVV